MPPLISVVIPVYNGQTTIRETVDSVLKQTLTDFELLIINDGSTDNTLEIVESIADPRIKIFSYPNKGLSASRNRGIREAASDLITFLDADDLWSSDKLATQHQVLTEHPLADVAYSWTDYIDENSEFLQAGLHITANGDVLAKLLTVNFIESGSNVLIRQSALRSVGFFDESLPAAEDWDMWLRLAQASEFVAVSAVQVFYRRTSSMSSNVVRQEQACLTVINRAFEKAPDSLQHLKRQTLAQLYKYLIFKALEGPPGKEKGWVAGKCLWRAVQYNPSLLKQHKVIVSVMLKIVTALFS